MLETVRYNYRLRPGAQATAALEAEWGRCRFLWNEAVHQQRTGRKPTLAKLGKLLTQARADFSWLREGSQNVQAQTLRTYDQSLRQSFKVKGRGRPVVKTRKKTLPSLEYSTRGFTLADGRLNLAKTPPIPVVQHRELPSAPSSVRVFRDSLGHWYASFVVRRENAPLPASDGKLGIDWGVTTTATTTDPAFDLPYQGFRKRSAAELARAQRKISRRRRARGLKQSNGYRDAQRQAARCAKKAQRQNTAVVREWAKKVVASHGLIAVEDFKPKFLGKSTMARKAADAALGIVKSTLIEYAERAGRKLVMVQPAYTTMTCSGCSARAKQRLDLSERIFVCLACGYVESRDRNAARVILAEAERSLATVESVRHSSGSSRGSAVQLEVESPRL